MVLCSSCNSTPFSIICLRLQSWFVIAHKATDEHTSNWDSEKYRNPMIFTTYFILLPHRMLSKSIQYLDNNAGNQKSSRFSSYLLLQKIGYNVNKQHCIIDTAQSQNYFVNGSNKKWLQCSQRQNKQITKSADISITQFSLHWFCLIKNIFLC